MVKGRYDTITVTKEDYIAWITLNLPHRLNALTMEMVNELIAAVEELEHDKDVRCVVITGAGDKAFSVGADITTFTEVTPTTAPDISARGQELARRIESSSKPYIAAINGYCLGGGLELALACDFRVAIEHAELGSPEIKIGIIPGWGGTQRLVRIVGLAKAKELVMLGERIKAYEALKLGLLHRVVASGKLMEEVKALAKKLAEGPPIALKYAKYVLNFGSQAPLDIGLKMESEALGIIASTKDVAEGISAFFEKRKPEFKGE
ncbi:MAG: enoyl-CoA hydratase/isomerase family protein [Candidatus Nezhaarchaeales archaeon]